MKITRIILVFLILTSVLLSGCTDRKPESSTGSADILTPTFDLDGSASPLGDSQEISKPEDASSTAPAESVPPASPGTAEAAAPTEELTPQGEDVDDTSDAIPVEENPTVYASGSFELIGGD